MNHGEIRMRVFPFLLAIVSSLVSYALSGFFEEKSWSNLAMITLIDFTFLWMVATARIDHNKKVFMCCIMAIMISIFTVPYSIVSYVYVYTDVVAINFLHNVMFEVFYPASIVTSFLLIVISILPKRIIHGVSKYTGINYHLGFFCHRVKTSLYNTNKGS